MAFRRRYLLVSGFLFTALLAHAEEKPAPPAASPHPNRAKAKEQASPAGPEVENVRKALEALTPEQRLNFRDNFIRWMNLSPDEKRTLREREEGRKKRIAEETEAAIRESGLTLDPAQRAKFAKRYAEERRRIEEKLRKEMENQRKPLLQDLIAQLRVEFSGTAPVAATPAPAR